MNLEELKEKFIKKINDEYDSFVKELKKQEAEVIIDRAYEHVCKQEMVYIYENKDYTDIEVNGFSLVEIADNLDEANPNIPIAILCKIWYN